MGIQKIHLCQAHLPWVAVNHPLHLGIKFTDRKFSLSKKNPGTDKKKYNSS